MPLLVE